MEEITNWTRKIDRLIPAEDTINHKGNITYKEATQIMQQCEVY